MLNTIKKALFVDSSPHFAFQIAQREKRNKALKLLNKTGMVAWREGAFDVEPRLRLLHPLTWLYIPVIVITSIAMDGLRDIKQDLGLFFQETVLW